MMMRLGTIEDLQMHFSICTQLIKTLLRNVNQQTVIIIRSLSNKLYNWHHLHFVVECLILFQDERRGRYFSTTFLVVAVNSRRAKSNSKTALRVFLFGGGGLGEENWRNFPISKLFPRYTYGLHLSLLPLVFLLYL